MIRSFFSYLAKAGWARKIVAKWSLAWKLASRFIAGESLPDGIRVIKELNAKGINATLDHLGENTDSPEQARQATDDIIQAITAIEQSAVRANVSIKLTQIGLGISDELVLENLAKILKAAQGYGSFVRIDMEDSSVTQRTLNILYKARELGYDNVGIVIQAYLYRSEADIHKLLGDCIKVRLCKGAYTEPAKIAFPKMRDIDANYDRCASILIDGSMANNCPRVSEDGKIPPIPGLATR